MNKFRVALCQIRTSADKSTCYERAEALIKEAKANGANLVVLPEIWNSPYGTTYFPKYAEAIPGGPTVKKMEQCAQDNKIFLIGGSISERTIEEKLYNTCLVFDPEGTIIGKHRKVHLFDIDVPGGQKFKESETLSAGDNVTVFEIPGVCKVGVGICYDIRFAEYAALMAKEGAEVLVYPAAFNMTTGPPHWKLLAQCRAVDNQCYVCMCSCARDESSSYVAYGHSLVVDAWGTVKEELSEKEGILFHDVDLESVKSVRQSIPVTKQKRTDVYNLTYLKK